MTPRPPCDPSLRFDRLERLFGVPAVQRLKELRVVVFGLGGVGSFAAEALARSAVGYLTLVDFDFVCATNVNRQLPATEATLGQPKCRVLRERLADIHPGGHIEALQAFYDSETSSGLLSPPWPGAGAYDVVVDCIDNLTAKAQLLDDCRQRGLRVVSSMGAAGKRDPTKVRTADLADVAGCHMGSDFRKILRRKHGFPRQGPMGVTAVFSTEKATPPRDPSGPLSCPCGALAPPHLGRKKVVFGTAAYVTGAFGLACAAAVVNFAAEEAGLTSE